MKNLKRTLSLFGIAAVSIAMQSQANAAKVFTINSPRMPGITRLRFADIRTGMIDADGKKLNRVAYLKPEFEFQGKFLRLGYDAATKYQQVSRLGSCDSGEIVPASRTAEMTCEAFGMRLVEFNTVGAEYRDVPEIGRRWPVDNLMVRRPTANFPVIEDNMVHMEGAVIDVVVCEK